MKWYGDIVECWLLDYDAAGNESPAGDKLNFTVQDTTLPPKPATPTLVGFIQE